MTDTEKVNAYMKALEHPLKAEIEAVRTIILKASDKIAERVKWNAPSFYYKNDLVTFNQRTDKHVHLVFHHIAVASIQSPILEGEYKDRRMTYFKNMDAIKANKKELERIINELVKAMDAE